MPLFARLLFAIARLQHIKYMYMTARQSATIRYMNLVALWWGRVRARQHDEDEQGRKGVENVIACFRGLRCMTERKPKPVQISYRTYDPGIYTPTHILAGHLVKHAGEWVENQPRKTGNTQIGHRDQECIDQLGQCSGSPRHA